MAYEIKLLINTKGSKMHVKLALGRSNYHSSTESLKGLHWLTMQQRIEFKILKITCKCINNSALKYLQDLISVKEIKRENMRSNTTGIPLNVPVVKQKCLQPDTSDMMHPHKWNRLPTNIRSTDSLDKFKGLLKTYLFHTAFC